ncbi:transcriptional regulator, TetR family [Bacillus thuringiensis]|nr:transcriptional regulator, TetR family [Bacillus thuringiensis]AJH67600.1 transcriptional regulator, TetR family [Bacillus thuringiensis]
MRRVKAYIKMMEVSVGAKEGSFNYMLEVLMKQR